MKYTFEITESKTTSDYSETKNVPAMSYKRVLKSLLNTRPKWSGMIEYTNKKGKTLAHFIKNGKKYRTDIIAL
tara:strand:- start:7 stop:225 length:219 start_codon:yes stop_codon:yes gene_type:complete